MGSRAYTIAGTLTYEPGDVILEVGSERGEGSTAYLASVGPVVWTIDVDPDRLSLIEVAARTRNVNGIMARAEDWLRHWVDVDPDGPHPIRFAWLDGHDWPYDGQSVAEAADYERLYRSRGQVYSRAASALSHRRIAEAIAGYVPPGGVIAIDDTWVDVTPDGVLHSTGKGGTAVPWLLTEGFELDPDLQVADCAVLRRP